MAQFYGSVQGQRGQASRLGSKRSGVTTTAASWEGAVTTTVSHDARLGVDVAEVRLTPWRGRGTSKLLYRGPVSGAAVTAEELPCDRQHETDHDCNQCRRAARRRSERESA
jgi:hypothetical protein